MHERELVWLDCGGPEACADHLVANRGWQIARTRSPAYAQRLIETKAARVGVVNFGSDLDTAKHLPALEELLDVAGRAEWIALVEPAMLAFDDVRRFIADHFHDYLTHPLVQDRFMHSLGHAYGMATLAGHDIPWRANLDGLERPVLTHCAGMRQIMRSLSKCAKACAPVTITGESGTGKELAARAVHQQSSQASGPFIAVNCGAIPENLIQAELFGHTKGAFSGADRDRAGRIEAARGGTLFLDEIGDLSLSLQVNLLRFLQEGIIEKIGAHQPIHVDTRVIAATHNNLEAAVAEGTFRHDLYYRLNVLHVHLPPLRDRAEDIGALANAYLGYFARRENSRVQGFSAQAIKAIGRYHWPGNIRELVNRIQRAVVMSDRRRLTAADLGLAQTISTNQQQTLHEVRGKAEKDALAQGLEHCDHNIAETARMLGVSRLTIYRLLDKHGLERALSGARPLQRGDTALQTPARQ